ncbi:MAG: hypothetical protein GF353_21340 [Candidatus Lokiarchaeota archaeon]|nr:hypothetical protein [Candidatus Lokiarchaeota archaeon]
MRKALLLNLVFIIISIICITLSFYIGFFFFLPIICFLPFTLRGFKGRNKSKEDYEENLYIRERSLGQTTRRCPSCGGLIQQPDAKFCYHCGKRLKE